jgi:hypothetical protein
VKLTLRTIVAIVLSAAAWTCAPVLAQGYPDKPIKLVVPYAPGGSTDLLARTLAQRMSESMGQPIIVENRGGGGMIGSDFVARAAADGYTLVLGTGATHGIVKFTSKALAYDPVKDFTALTEAVEVPIVLAVHSSVPANDAKEFVDYVKENPADIHGSSGTGSPHQWPGNCSSRSPIDMVHVPYKGAGSHAGPVGGQSASSATCPRRSPGPRRQIRILGPGSQRQRCRTFNHWRVGARPRAAFLARVSRRNQPARSCASTLNCERAHPTYAQLRRRACRCSAQRRRFRRVVSTTPRCTTLPAAKSNRRISGRLRSTERNRTDERVDYTRRSERPLGEDYPEIHDSVPRIAPIFRQLLARPRPA